MIFELIGKSILAGMLSSDERLQASHFIFPLLILFTRLFGVGYRFIVIAIRPLQPWGRTELNTP